MPDLIAKPYNKLKLSKTKDGVAEIEATISVEALQSHVDAAFKKAQREFVLPGFRKGLVPEHVFKQYVNRMELLQEATEPALTKAYHAIVKDEHLEPMGHPEVTITKMAPGNPLEFKAVVPLMPEFKLPDYKKIAKRVVSEDHPPTVKDEDVDKTIHDILSIREQKQAAKGEEKPEEPKGAPKSAGEAEKQKPASSPKEPPLPELTDEYVKKLGAFENVADFKSKIKASLLEEKQHQQEARRRELIAKHLIDAVKFDIPKQFIDTEAGLLKHQREERVKKHGATMEVYLKQVDKTEEDIIAEEHAYAERQLRTRFIFEKIAETEKLTAAPEEVAHNLELLKRQHPNADEERLRQYVAAMVVNEKVLRLLEGRLPEPKGAIPTQQQKTPENTAEKNTGK